jgi:hypothetical protein
MWALHGIAVYTCSQQRPSSLWQDAAEVADQDDGGDAQHDVEEVVAGHGGVCVRAREALFIALHTADEATHAATHSPRRQSPGTPDAASISEGSAHV